MFEADCEVIPPQPMVKMETAGSMSHLIAVGEQAREDGAPWIDPRLLLEDSSFNHRITQVSDSVILEGVIVTMLWRSNGPLRLTEMTCCRVSWTSQPRSGETNQGGFDQAGRFKGEDSSVRNRTGFHISPLGESNRILLRKAITLPSFSGLTRDGIA